MGRNRGHNRLSPQDGHARGAEAVLPPQSGDRVLPRLDQKQTGIAPVPPARPGQSANGNALGLPHLQPARVDPPAQTTNRNRLNPQQRETEFEKTPAQTKLRLHFPQPLHPPSLVFMAIEGGFFTASNRETWGFSSPQDFGASIRAFRQGPPLQEPPRPGTPEPSVHFENYTHKRKSGGRLSSFLSLFRYS